jgi:beta-glucosidase-like glycosyl hydrolase
MAQFSARELLAQCLIVRVSADDYYSPVTGAAFRESMERLVRDEGVGGVCVFAGGAVETAQMLVELQTFAKLGSRPPLLVCADFEHGAAMRLQGATAFPHAFALGVADNPETTEKIARAIAREAKALGVHWNLAPVADIASNLWNPVINIRSFGETPDLVSRHVAAYIRGLRAEGVMATAKHFPGHGDTSVDSHLELPILRTDAETLRKREFEPFRAAVRAEVDALMMGHIAVPALELNGAADLPASLSSRIMTDCARAELGFEGVIVTDGLDMRAITARFSPAEAAVRAFVAGADALLLSPDTLAALDALEAAYNGETNERISPEKLNASAARVLGAKARCGLVRIDAPAAPLDTLALDKNDVVRLSKRSAEDFSAVNKQEHSLLALDAAKPSLRWFGDVETILPLQKFQQIAGFAFVRETDVQTATSFFRYLSQLYKADCDFAFIDGAITDEEIDELRSGLRGAEAFVFALFERGVANIGGKPGAPPRYNDAIRRLSGGAPSAAAVFGNPSLAATLPVSAGVCAFSFAEPSLGATAAALVGELPENVRRFSLA